MSILTVGGKVVLAGGKPIIPPQGGELPQQEKSVTITKNGQTSVTPDDGKTLSKVDVTVAVPSGAKPEQTKTARITANGTTKVLPDSGKVLSEVDVYVAVPSDAKVEEEKTVSITENGTTEITPTSGKVLSKATVNVNVPQLDIGELNVTANGTYTAGKDVDAWNKVTVDVPQLGGGSTATPVDPSDITFIDYDGTVVAAWTLAELASKTALPDAPTHDGLVFQEWNYTLTELKEKNSQVVVGALYDTDDGSTRIYIHLQEGRTSPMLGCCPNGTVTVDWGDGTTLDTLTGSGVYTLKWTPTHNYAAAGDYVIKLTMSDGGTLGLAGAYSVSSGSALLRQTSSGDKRNIHYASAIKKVELGSNVINLGSGAFCYCVSLDCISSPNSITTIGARAFTNVTGLRAFCAKEISFWNAAMNSATAEVFYNCYSLKYISAKISNTYITQGMFDNCYALRLFPDYTTKQILSMQVSAFENCHSLTNVKVVLSSTSVIRKDAFYSCYGVRVYDFSMCLAVPTLDTDVFYDIAEDCEIRVPASLADTWKAATNWATYADHIVGV